MWQSVTYQAVLAEAREAGRRSIDRCQSPPQRSRDRANCPCFGAVDRSNSPVKDVIIGAAIAVVQGLTANLRFVGFFCPHSLAQ
ncbi:MAG: hypothetical protein HC805_06435 [Alkalinema sp. RL_2_19]|nr:hypothetical protein [Alkalinema sp. RL_2_19]